MSLKHILLLAFVFAAASAQFGFRPPQFTFFRRPSQNRPNRPPPPPFRPGPPAGPRPGPPSGPRPGPPSNSGSTVNIGGNNYWLSWREGRNSYDWFQARSECTRRNGEMVVMTDRSVYSALRDILIRDGKRRAPYFWAGAKLEGSQLVWVNGEREGYSRGRAPWSSVRSQPETSSECLAVLNDFYPGDRGQPFWHDVSCDHGKPVVCKL